MSRVTVTRTIRALTIAIMLTQLWSMAALAAHCDHRGDDAEQLRCELESHAGPAGKRLVADRYFSGDQDTTEPQEYCYSEMHYKASRCTRDASGNSSCSLLTQGHFECGASGTAFGLFRCSKRSSDGRVFCAHEADDGENIPDHMTRNVQRPAFSSVDGLGHRFVAALGSYQSETAAYQHGRNVYSEANRAGLVDELNLAVIRVRVSGTYWYRVVGNRPTSRDAVVRLCERVKSNVTTACAPALTSLIVTPDRN